MANEVNIRASLKDDVGPGLKKIRGEFDALGTNAGRAAAGVSSASARMGSDISRHVGQGVHSAIGNLQKLGLAAGAGLASQVVLGIKSLAAQQAVEAQTAAAIKSTGGAAKVSASQVRDLSNALEDKTTIDNKEIQAAANLMLTFTNVRNEAGKGNDVFTQSVGVMTDLATAMHTDVSSGAIQLGKALNDPIKGITALTRIGVTFDDQQKKQIATMVKAGDTMGAQKIILAELNKEFGGSGAAAADTYEGKMRRLGDAVEGVQQSLATALLPTLTDLATEANKFLRDPKVLAGIESFGKNLAAGAKGAVSWLKSLNWEAIGSGLKLAGEGAKTIVGAFAAAPPWVQEFLTVGFVANKFTGGAISGIIGDVAKGLIKGVLGMNAGVVNINAGAVNGGLPGGGKGSGILGLLPAATIATAIVAAAVPIGEAFASALPAWLKGPDGSGKSQSQLAVEREKALSGIVPVTSGDLGRHGPMPVVDKATAAAIAGLAKSLDLRAKAREIAPTQQLAFIGSHSDAGAVTVANAIADKFAKVQTPYYRSQQNAERALKKLEGLQQRLLDHGDTKGAAIVAKDIASMKTVLNTAIHGTTTAVGQVAGQLKNALGGLLYTGGGRPTKDDPIRPRTPSVQDTQNWRDGNAVGGFGMTRGLTNIGSLGVAGEAGGEAIAIVRNPKPIHGGMGGSVTINVNVHSSKGVITPGVAHELMQTLGPLLTTYLQRQGIIPRLGTPLRG